MCWFYHRWGKWAHYTEIRRKYEKYPKEVIVGFTMARDCSVCGLKQVKRHYT